MEGRGIQTCSRSMKDIVSKNMEGKLSNQYEGRVNLSILQVWKAEYPGNMIGRVFRQQGRQSIQGGGKAGYPGSRKGRLSRQGSMQHKRQGIHAA